MKESKDENIVINYDTLINLQDESSSEYDCRIEKFLLGYKGNREELVEYFAKGGARPWVKTLLSNTSAKCFVFVEPGAQTSYCEDVLNSLDLSSRVDIYDVNKDVVCNSSWKTFSNEDKLKKVAQNFFGEENNNITLVSNNEEYKTAAQILGWKIVNIEDIKESELTGEGTEYSSSDE